jgi:uncharacterized protein (TIGR03032 family)
MLDRAGPFLPDRAMTDTPLTDIEPAAEVPAPAADPAPILLGSQNFPAWLAAENVSLAFTTYQAGRLFMIGRKPDGAMRAHERLIDHCQGLWTNGQTVWTSAKNVLWRFRNDLPEGQTTERGADRRFVPREGRVTGAIDMHDIGVGDVGGGRIGPIFVNTAFNCLATLSREASFRPLWMPPFVSTLAREDRCHLNGLAMDGTRPAYVTAVSRSDVADGWRDRRRDGGVIVDVASGEIVASGFSMPHSPRLYDGKLWVLNSGRGEFGTVDPATGQFTSVAFCPGYARGLAFTGRYAVIGLSRPRRNQTFEGLELDERLAAKDAEPRCGLIIVDLASGRTVEWVRFEHTIEELYDVAVMPGVVQPEAIGFRGDGMSQAITVET